MIWVAASLVCGVLLARFVEDPSFSGSEIPLALAFRRGEVGSIFYQLISWLQDGAGYGTQSLRLLPTVFGVIAVFFWAKLILSRIQRNPIASESASIAGPPLCAAAFLLASASWLKDLSVLGSCSLELWAVLIPFLRDDSFFNETLLLGKRPGSLCRLWFPALLSKFYPWVLMARVLGWWVHAGLEGAAGKVRLGRVIWLVLGALLLTLVRVGFESSAGTGARAISTLALLGQLRSHSAGGLAPFLFFGLLALAGLGTLTSFRDFARRHPSGDSRVLSVVFALASGSLLLSVLKPGEGLLAFAPSIFFIQWLAVEGILVLPALFSGHGEESLKTVSIGMSLLGTAFLIAAVPVFLSAAMALESGRSGAHDPKEILPRMKKLGVEKLYVDRCAVDRLTAMPEPFQVRKISWGNKEEIPWNEKILIFWIKKLDDRPPGCQDEIALIQSKARTWDVILENPDFSLVSAIF